KLPHLRNPDAGYLVTANNDPFGFTRDGDVQNDPFYFSAFFDKGFRAHRISAVLQGLIRDKPGAITRADMEALQRVVHSRSADSLIPHPEEAIEAMDPAPALAAYSGRRDLVELAGRLSAWDRNFDSAAAEPVVFLGLEWFAMRRVFEKP